METIIAACGLVCSRCDAYRATRANDAEKLELVAADWRKRYNCQEIAAENIRCNGCMVEGGPKCSHCGQSCGIRRCAIAKEVSTCSQCSEFPCAELDNLYGFMGEQGNKLRSLQQALHDAENAMHSAF